MNGKALIHTFFYTNTICIFSRRDDLQTPFIACNINCLAKDESGVQEAQNEEMRNKAEKIIKRCLITF